MNHWTPAYRQARRIGATKTVSGKRRAVLTWCRHVKHALKGTQ